MSEQLTRRGFFRLFGGAAAAAAVAAVAPTYFIPPIGGWKSDVIANPLLELEKELGYRAAQSIDSLLTVFYDKRFIENLKRQTPFLKAAGVRVVPEVSRKAVTFETVRLSA